MTRTCFAVVLLCSALLYWGGHTMSVNEVAGAAPCTNPWNNFECPMPNPDDTKMGTTPCSTHNHQLVTGGGTKWAFNPVPAYGNCNTHTYTNNLNATVACPGAAWDSADFGCDVGPPV